MLPVSAMILTHNPRPDYLNRVLEALRKQTLPTSQWELLLIDNASDEPLAARFDLSWHPRSRHVREERIGLTQARLCGVRESTGDVLIFFDDDTVAEPGYLAKTLEIAAKWPMLGVWGGQVIGEFEIPPPSWIQPHLYFLALKEHDRDSWSNIKFQHQSTPCGAGMCIRRPVADYYAKIVANDPRRAGLDRIGNQLLSHGDVDLAYTAIDMGLGTAQLKDLKLTHLIPKSRLEKDYILRLIEGGAYSGVWVDYFHGKLPARPSSMLRLWLRTLRMDQWSGQMLRALYRGKNAAIRDIAARQDQPL